MASVLPVDGPHPAADLHQAVEVEAGQPDLDGPRVVEARVRVEIVEDDQQAGPAGVAEDGQ
jgi:hypothetical protein